MRGCSVAALCRVGLLCHQPAWLALHLGLLLVIYDPQVGCALRGVVVPACMRPRWWAWCDPPETLCCIAEVYPAAGHMARACLLGWHAACGCLSRFACLLKPCLCVSRGHSATPRPACMLSWASEGCWRSVPAARCMARLGRAPLCCNVYPPSTPFFVGAWRAAWLSATALRPWRCPWFRPCPSLCLLPSGA